MISNHNQGLLEVGGSGASKINSIPSPELFELLK